MADLGDSPTLNPMQGYGDALGLGPGWRPTPAGNGLVTITLPTGQRVTINAQSAPQFAGFLGTLAGGGAPMGNIGGYNYRNIAGTNTLSKHASGNAVDVGDQSGRDIVSPQFRDWYNNNQPLIRQAMAQNGIVSGGDWRNPDLGHFEVGRAPPLSGPQQSYAMASNLQGSGDGTSGQALRQTSSYNSTPYNPGPQGTIMNTGAPTQNSGEIVGQGTRGWNIYQTTPTWTGSPLSQAPEARDEGDFRAPSLTGPQTPLGQRQAQIRQLILQQAMANIPGAYQFKLG